MPRGAGAKKGNINASLHKIYLKKILNKDELKVFTSLYDDIAERHTLEARPADQMLLSVALIDFIRTMRGLQFEVDNPDADISDALERATRSLRNNLSEMGITGKYKTVDDATTSFSAVLTAIAKAGTP